MCISKAWNSNKKPLKQETKALKQRDIWGEGKVLIVKVQFYHYFQELQMVRQLKCLADILEINNNTSAWEHFTMLKIPA